MILRNKIVTINLTGKVGLTVTYPAAEPDALEDIVSVGVVVPLDAVQTSSSADHRRQSPPVASSRAASDTPQKHNCRLSPELANSKTVSEQAQEKIKGQKTRELLVIIATEETDETPVIKSPLKKNRRKLR